MRWLLYLVVVGLVLAQATLLGFAVTMATAKPAFASADERPGSCHKDWTP
jgi:hypothetical protein